MKEISLSNGELAKVDDEDYSRLSAHRWHLLVGPSGVHYAYRHIRNDGKKTSLLMHREILNAKPRQQIDHRDRQGLNNQKMNLRFSTQSENVSNSRLRTNNRSGFKGVHFDRSTRSSKKWFAQITHNLKVKFLGRFLTAREAATVYDNWARRIHGDFASTNKELGIV